MNRPTQHLTITYRARSLPAIGASKLDFSDLQDEETTPATQDNPGRPNVLDTLDNDGTRFTNTPASPPSQEPDPYTDQPNYRWAIADGQFLARPATDCYHADLLRELLGDHLAPNREYLTGHLAIGDAETYYYAYGHNRSNPEVEHHIRHWLTHPRTGSGDAR